MQHSPDGRHSPDGPGGLPDAILDAIPDAMPVAMPGAGPQALAEGAATGLQPGFLASVFRDLGAASGGDPSDPRGDGGASTRGATVRRPAARYPTIGSERAPAPTRPSPRTAGPPH